VLEKSAPPLEEGLLADAYLLSSVLFANPEAMERESTDARIDNLCNELELQGRPDIAHHFGLFREELWDISEDEYLFTLEMTPSSPPYLGSYGFDAPKSCSDIGANERNMYMIEVAAVYKHYGMEMEHGEMPDYFPAICEFLAISLVEEDLRARKLRKGFIESLVLPFLPDFIRGLGKKPWAHIVTAVAELIATEIEGGVEG
jgi:nitrate reductase assembly molybdenum cofactor insertion protein NarJ|tara:strand:- start:11593 stop:12198 length:606 start_codon:yes stop_codon:yes gene_type:complete